MKSLTRIYLVPQPEDRWDCRLPSQIYVRVWSRNREAILLNTTPVLQLLLSFSGGMWELIILPFYLVLFWKRSTPLQVKIHASMPALWPQLANLAGDHWKTCTTLRH